MGEKFGLVVGPETRAHEGGDGVLHLDRIMIADQAKRDLGRRLCRNDRLGALAGVTADDAVHVAGRPRPNLLEHAAASLSGRHGYAHVREKTPFIESQRRPLRLDLSVKLAHAVIKAGDSEARFSIM